MSKYIQIDIRLRPFYEKPLVKVFPKIAKLMSSMDYKGPLEKEPSLYVLIDTLVSMLRDDMVPSDIKEKINPYVTKMKTLKETARELLLSRKLNELDQILYQIEDQFLDLESSL
jgi:hypothetical protein